MPISHGCSRSSRPINPTRCAASFSRTIKERSYRRFNTRQIGLMRRSKPACPCAHMPCRKDRNVRNDNPAAQCLASRFTTAIRRVVERERRPHGSCLRSSRLNKINYQLAAPILDPRRKACTASHRVFHSRQVLPSARPGRSWMPNARSRTTQTLLVMRTTESADSPLARHHSSSALQKRPRHPVRRDGFSNRSEHRLGGLRKREISRPAAAKSGFHYKNRTSHEHRCRNFQSRQIAHDRPRRYRHPTFCERVGAETTNHSLRTSTATE